MTTNFHKFQIIMILNDELFFKHNAINYAIFYKINNK
jgi:hypothetical protein